jgi:hypothetical protein
MKHIFLFLCLSANVFADKGNEHLDPLGLFTPAPLAPLVVDDALTDPEDFDSSSTSSSDEADDHEFVHLQNESEIDEAFQDISETTSRLHIMLRAITSYKGSISSVFTAIEKYGALTSLRIEGLTLTSGDGLALKALLEKLPHLNTLKIESSCLDGLIVAPLLANALLYKPTLTSLTLDDCRVDDIGAKALAMVLPHMTMLKTLDLENNEISNAGLQFLFWAFQYMPKLTEIILAGNSLGYDPTNLETFIKTSFPQITGVDLDYTEGSEDEAN